MASMEAMLRRGCFIFLLWSVYTDMASVGMMCPEVYPEMYAA